LCAGHFPTFSPFPILLSSTGIVSYWFDVV
jgi:hypothetical protein